MDSRAAIEIVIGAFLLLLGVITLIPRVIDSFFEFIRSPHFLSLWGPGFLTFGRPEWSWKWSRRLAHIWMPGMCFLVGVMMILQGAGVLD